MKLIIIQLIFKILLPLVILTFLVSTVINNWVIVRTQLILADPYSITLILVMLMITYVGGAYLWRMILEGLGAYLTYFQALKIFTVSNFGRFIPGVAIHYFIRVYMSKRIGLKVKDSALAVILEAYYTLAGAVFAGFFACPVVADLIRIPIQGVYLMYSILLLYILLVKPDLLLKFLLNIKFVRRKITGKIVIFSYQKHFLLCLVSTILFVFNGVAFYFLGHSFFNLDISNLFFITGLFALSWILGFLTPVAPGGLGVSDLSFAFLLSTIFSFAQASFLVILYRMGLLISEGLVFLIVFIFFRADLIQKRN